MVRTTIKGEVVGDPGRWQTLSKFLGDETTMPHWVQLPHYRALLRIWVLRIHVIRTGRQTSQMGLKH
jgi:hypothetical protein